MLAPDDPSDTNGALENVSSILLIALLNAAHPLSMCDKDDECSATDVFVDSNVSLTVTVDTDVG